MTHDQQLHQSGTLRDFMRIDRAASLPHVNRWDVLAIWTAAFEMFSSCSLCFEDQSKALISQLFISKVVWVRMTFIYNGGGGVGGDAVSTAASGAPVAAV